MRSFPMTSPSRRYGSPRTKRGKATRISRSKQAQSLRHGSSRTKRGKATGVSRIKQAQKTGYDHNDPSLKTCTGGLTVWTLQEMARTKRFDELNSMFNNGLSMNAL